MSALRQIPIETRVVTEARIILIDRNQEVVIGRMNGKPYHSQPINYVLDGLYYTDDDCFEVETNHSFNSNNK